MIVLNLIQLLVSIWIVKVFIDSIRRDKQQEKELHEYRKVKVELLTHMAKDLNDIKKFIDDL